MKLRPYRNLPRRKSEKLKEIAILIVLALTFIKAVRGDIAGAHDLLAGLLPFLGIAL